MTWVAYLIMAAGTSYVQLMYIEDLSMWYYLGDDAVEEEEVEEVLEEVEEEFDGY